MKKGSTHTLIAKEKIRLNTLGRPAWNKNRHITTNTGKTHFKKGFTPWNKGKKGVMAIPWNKNKKGIHLSPNSELKKGEKIKNWNGFRKGHISWNKGKEHKAMKGEKNPVWKGGLTKLQEQIRKCFQYRQWRSDVFERDNFTCQECKTKGGKLHAHHIKSFSKIMKEYNIKSLEQALNCEELWNINNGITLCLECHKLTDNYLKQNYEFI